MRAPHEAGRVLALVLVVLVLTSTAWVCLIGAAVVLLSHWMDAGLALLAVGGALVALLAVIMAVVGAVRRSKLPAPSLGQRVVPAAVVQSAMGVMAHPLALRIGLLLIGVALAVSAVLLPGRGPKGGDPPS